MQILCNGQFVMFDYKNRVAENFSESRMKLIFTDPLGSFSIDVEFAQKLIIDL